MQTESPPPENTQNRRFLRAIVTVLIINASVAIGQVYAVSPIGVGGIMALFITLMAVFPALLALIAIPVTFLLALFPVHRAWALRSFVIAIVCFVTFVGAIGLGKYARRSAFHALATRSQPLVDAIHKYTKDTGAPPPLLKALVPTYISEIPGTGMPAYPDYEYSIDANRWHGNPWALYVDTPSGGLNWDIFLYYPLQNYPKNAHGGSLELMQTWAYVHE